MSNQVWASIIFMAPLDCALVATRLTNREGAGHGLSIFVLCPAWSYPPPLTWVARSQVPSAPPLSLLLSNLSLESPLLLSILPAPSPLGIDSCGMSDLF